METSLRERSLPQTGRLRSTVWSTRKHIREKQLLRNKRSSRGEQDRKKKQEIIWLKKKSCKMTDFFFIAGYTSGGAPYGVTWEEMGLKPWEENE